MELRNFRRGRHPYSAGQPSRWSSAHILVSFTFHPIQIFFSISLYLHYYLYFCVTNKYDLIGITNCNASVSVILSVKMKRLLVDVDHTTRQLVGDHRHDHNTPVLATCHWLPVRQQVTFKTAVLPLKCLNDEAPAVLGRPVRCFGCLRGWSSIRPQSRGSRPATSGALLVPCSRTSMTSAGLLLMEQYFVRRNLSHGSMLK